MRVWLKEVRLRIGAVTTAEQASCPGCGCSSGRVDSRYVRYLVDTCVGGREVNIALTVRRLLRPDRLRAEDVRGAAARADHPPWARHSPGSPTALVDDP